MLRADRRVVLSHVGSLVRPAAMIPYWKKSATKNPTRRQRSKMPTESVVENRCRTTVDERLGETLAELSFTGDQVGLLKGRPGRGQTPPVDCGTQRKLH
jgi:hypothetical protein